MNARDELLEAVKESGSVIKCASITYDDWLEDAKPKYILSVGHDKQEEDRFLEYLNFDYDDSYGSQRLFGLVWLEDGTWLSRGEYDGSEWWEHNVLPPIPDDLKASP